MTTNENIRQNPAFKDCPTTLLREINISGKTVAIEEERISLIRQVAPEKRNRYLKTNHVPLKDFGRFMRSFSHEFKGGLSTIKDSKLKKLILPIMVPVGMELPPIPDENATHLIILSNGQWHGVIFCSMSAGGINTMVKFKKAKNGDIAGIGCLEDNGEVPLLSAVSILTREGFLTMT